MRYEAGFSRQSRGCPPIPPALDPSTSRRDQALYASYRNIDNGETAGEDS